MGKAAILEALDVGASVAESDQHLASYFVATGYLADLTKDRVDIVRGAKGSGKSALLKVVGEHPERFPELSDVRVVPATNHSGDPVFRIVFNEFERPAVEADERKLVDAWKLYWLNLVLKSVPTQFESLPGVADLNKEVGRFALKTGEHGLIAILKYALTRMLFPTKIMTAFVSPAGAGVLKTEYPPARPPAPDDPVPFDDLFGRLDAILRKAGVRTWLLLDRLDEAFPGKPALEQRALRSLLYAYKDLLGLTNIRIKVFIRDDIYSQVTQGEGFAALTHVGGRASSPIRWDEDGLLSLIVQRILWTAAVRKYVNEHSDPSSRGTREAAFYTVFEPKVDASEKRPTTVNWVTSRIRDGNGVMTPRDLIELVRHARSIQLEKFARESVDESAPALITGDTLKNALIRLSTDKVENTLFAEYPHLRSHILKFKGDKAEQNEESLKRLLGPDVTEVTKELVQVGFLEKLVDSYKIPFLYRDGAGVTRGRAF